MAQPDLKAIRDAVPTSRHGSMLFDMVRDHLGGRAHVETAAGGAQRLLFARERPGSEVILPWPVAGHSAKGRLSVVFPPPDDDRPRPGRAPNLRGLGPGEIVVHDGATHVTVTYGADGRAIEMAAHDPGGWAAAVAALGSGGARPVELFAGYIAVLDFARHGPGRLHLPVPLPGGVDGAWLTGLAALREALFDEQVPPAARWAVADGYEGTALAWGTTREEALEAWRAEVARRRPRPAPAVEPEDPEDDLFESSGDEFRARFTLRAPPSDVPQPDPTPENTPAAIVPLRPPPETAPPAGCWAPLLDRFGNLTYAAVRHRPDGFWIVGPGAAERVDLDDVERLIAEAPRPPWPDASPEVEAPRPPANYDLAWYARDGDAFRYAGGSRGEAFTPASLDGGFVHDLVGRLRYLA